jgi:hypothetical protein
MPALDGQLDRWERHGLLSAEQAGRIREFAVTVVALGLGA